MNARWLLDLEEFNEWMNEEDYLVDEDSSVSTLPWQRGEGCGMLGCQKQIEHSHGE